MHKITIDKTVLHPEDGLILGNGDLSVSIFQSADQIIWRFGKGDVWDRRIDTSEDPRPADIEEIADGIRKEGWKCGAYGEETITATKGTSNSQRMKELCQGSPRSYDYRPYPCPKPTGELVLHLSPDLQDLQMTQTLQIEQGIVMIECSWAAGIRLSLECLIPEDQNVLLLQWELKGPDLKFTDSDHDRCPLWFTLWRHKDPDMKEYLDQRFQNYRVGLFPTMTSEKVTPLPGPRVMRYSGCRCIEQCFYPDLTFADGFSCLLTPVMSSGTMLEWPDSATNGAGIDLLPEADCGRGYLCIAVFTTSQAKSAKDGLIHFMDGLDLDLEKTYHKWKTQSIRQNRLFWEQSALSISDQLLEKVWYESIYAQKCIYKGGTVPPGLFFPSTLQDFSHWHGDFHTNYNFQQPFWGMLTSNHTALLDSYFDGICYLAKIGRKIAREYYHCRGTFIQLTGYPMVLEDDPVGVVPMGRMAYMTGWAMTLYWQRYLYTMDKGWLRETGYPMIRDCALFYHDFMKMGEDGLYHVFPSNQGEDGFSGREEDFTDRTEIMIYLRYSLHAAVKASKILDVDAEFRQALQERLDLCAGNEANPPVSYLFEEEEPNPPEFEACYEAEWMSTDGSPWPGPNHHIARWYFGHYPLFLMKRIHKSLFQSNADFPVFRKTIEKFHHTNGLVWAMSCSQYGRSGAWTESLGVTAPLQEMMLQSWSGKIHLFPALPKEIDAKFTGFRAMGGFLITAEQKNGCVEGVEIYSEHGSICKIINIWNKDIYITTMNNKKVEFSRDKNNQLCFQTESGVTYQLKS